MMFPMTAGQFDLVYNSLSFTLACMGASTFFFWIRLGSVHEKYKSAMTITCANRSHTQVHVACAHGCARACASAAALSP